MIPGGHNYFYLLDVKTRYPYSIPNLDMFRSIKININYAITVMNMTYSVEKKHSYSQILILFEKKNIYVLFNVMVLTGFVRLNVVKTLYLIYLKLAQIN